MFVALLDRSGREPSSGYARQPFTPGAAVAFDALADWGWIDGAALFRDRTGGAALGDGRLATPFMVERGHTVLFPPGAITTPTDHAEA